MGLAIQHAYNAGKAPDDQLDYNQILQKYIIDAVGMPSFSQSRPADGKTNPADPVAPYIQGNPGGCYWTNAQDLAKFGQWIYQTIQSDPPLKKLVQDYGQEFYVADAQLVRHGGAGPSASTNFSVYLQTGIVLTALSVQPRMADDLVQMVRANIFSKPAEPEAAASRSHGIAEPLGSPRTFQAMSGVSQEPPHDGPAPPSGK